MLKSDRKWSSLETGLVDRNGFILQVPVNHKYLSVAYFAWASFLFPIFFFFWPETHSISRSQCVPYATKPASFHCPRSTSHMDRFAYNGLPCLNQNWFTLTGCVITMAFVTNHRSAKETEAAVEYGMKNNLKLESSGRKTGDAFYQQTLLRHWNIDDRSRALQFEVSLTYTSASAWCVVHYTRITMCQLLLDLTILRPKEIVLARKKTEKTTKVN